MKLRLRQRAQLAGSDGRPAHPRMIGAGPLLGGLGICLLGLLLGLRPAAAEAADPTLAAARHDTVRQAAADAANALDRLATLLDSAREAARSGSALIISGVDPPGAPLLDAAARLEGGADEVTDVAATVARLRGILAAVAPDASGPALALSPTDLLGIASQLRQAAPVATDFVQRRHAAEETLAELGAALAALTRNEPDRAAAAIDRARSARQTVAAWEQPPPELAVWLETTGEMLTAADRIAAALRAGDQAAATAAGTAYAAAAQRAAVADRALALSIAEVGSAITLTPLQRLASAADAVASTEGWVASVLQ